MVELRLTTVLFEMPFGPSQPFCAIEIKCPKARGCSVHVIDHFLGNNNGQFNTAGNEASGAKNDRDMSNKFRFSHSSRNVRLSTGLLTAELRAVDGGWRTATLAVRAQCIHKPPSVWTHELVIGDGNEPTPETVVRSSCFDLGYRCENLRLKGASWLKAYTLHHKDVVHNNYGYSLEPNLGRQFEEWYEYGISLDPLVGNSNGSFSTAEQNFSASARNVHLRNATLHAELRTVNGQWKRAEIDLRLLVCSLGDGLEPADPRRALRVAPPRNIKTAALRDRLYMPLKNDTDLRMCYIKSGGFGDEVKCNLVTRQAEDLQEYLCLSYVWGDVGDPATIQVNTQKKPVTRNLHMAMRRLRAHGYEGALWIDALCINQADIDEKSIQVSRMSSTYAKAQRVFVWLDSFEHSATDQLGYSPLAATVATFFGLLASNAHMTEAIKQSVSSPSQPTANSSLDGSWEEQAPIDYLVRALRTFVSSRWFERTWTIQEFVLSRELMYAFGDELLDTKTVKSALKRMECHLRTCCKTALYGMSETARLLLESVLTDLQNVFTAQDGIQKLSEGARKKPKDENDSIWSARNPSVEGSLSLISSLDQLLDGTPKSSAEISKHLKFPGATLLYSLAKGADSLYSRVLLPQVSDTRDLHPRGQVLHSDVEGVAKSSAEEADGSTCDEEPTLAAMHPRTPRPSTRGKAGILPTLGQLTQRLGKDLILKSKAQGRSSTYIDNGTSEEPESKQRDECAGKRLVGEEGRQTDSHTTPDVVRLQNPQKHAAHGHRSNLMHLTSQLLGSKKPGAHTPHPAVDCALQLLSQCRVKQCSDPRDRVFAFIDIATQALGMFKPDYAVSVNGLYKSFTLRIIDHVGNLDIWSLRQPHAESELSSRSKLPSWAIDWACADFRVQSCYDLQSELLKAPLSFSLSPIIYNLIGDDMLSVYGTKLDAIQATTSRPWAPCKRGLSEVQVPGESELGDWLQFLGIRTAERNPDKDVLWDSFYALLTAKQALKYTVDTYHGSLPGSARGHSWREATQADRDLFSAWAAREQQHDSALPTPTPDELLAVRRVVDTIAGAKSLFRTGEGRIGLCPPWTQPDDELYCVSGCRWPVVFRRHSETGRQIGKSTALELVGTCYTGEYSQDNVGRALVQAREIYIC